MLNRFVVDSTVKTRRNLSAVNTTSREGRRLLAHETVHTVQDGGARPMTSAEVSQPGDPQEVEADRIADAFESFARVPASAEPAAAAAPSLLVVRAGPGAAVQRQPDAGAPKGPQFGHAKSCDLEKHLKPYIHDGHKKARAMLAKVKGAIASDSPDSTVAGQLRTYFGTDATKPENLKTIRARFDSIAEALDGSYLFHCDEGTKLDEDGAEKCTVNNAETSTSGNRDITLCFVTIRKRGYNVLGVAMLMIHENYHRAFGGSAHVWRPEGLEGCINQTSTLSQSALVTDNPDSYSCFALTVASDAAP
jgi:hypothetical protein